MRLLLSALLASCFWTLAFSQTIKVVEKEEKIENMQRKGYAVLIQLERSFVGKNWSKKVKTYGKADISGNEYIIHQAIVPEISANPIKLYSRINEKAKLGTEVWLAVDLGMEFITKSHAKSLDAEKILYQFALETYQLDVQMQLEEAESALVKTSRNYEKSMAGESKVKDKMQRNVEQKKGLLDQIKKNKADSLQLVKELDLNKVEQKLDSLEVVKMRRAVEVVKAKLTTIK